MSIYGNAAKKTSTANQIKSLKETQLRKHKISNQTKSADTNNIRNNKDLTSIVKSFDKSLGATKEILYDHDKNIIGLLLRSGEPHFFTEKQSKEFAKFIGA